MHEVFKIKSLKPIPKFQQKLNNFEKPQNFSKTPSPWSKRMKCMKNEKKRKHTKWFEARRVWKSCELKVLREKRVLRRWKDGSVKKEIEKSEKRIVLNEYIGV